MSIQRAFLVSVLAILAVPAAAQEVHVLEAAAEAPKAVTSGCSGGVVYDGGVFNGGYSLGNGDPGDATVVMRFALPAGTTSLDQVCVCFSRSTSSAPTSMSFDVVVYDDNSPGGQPGTLVATVPATATSLPDFNSGGRFYSVNLAGSGITLPDSNVYIGARWPGGEILMCGDTSGSTPQRESYGSFNSGLSWSSMQSLFSGPFTTAPRAMGIRTDPASGPAPACVPGPNALCLNNGRFRVEATFQTPAGASGPVQGVKLTDETGYLWFFTATNVETVVKLLNGCALNNRFWLFAGGLTDVRTVIKVTDTKNGTVKTYTNPQSTPFQPIQDTSAFATCP